MVAEFGDLFGSVDFGEAIIMKLVGAKLGIREDTDAGEEIGEIFEGAKGNDAVFGNGIMVGVDFDGITPMDAVGDSHSKK